MNPTVTRGAQVGSRALAGERARTQPALRYGAHSPCTGPRPSVSVLGSKRFPSSGAQTAESQAVPSPETLRRGGRLPSRAGEAHSQAPSPAPHRGLHCSSSPGSVFPILNRQTSRKSGPPDPVSASATSAARDLCPGRKRKRAGPGAPTPCLGGPGQDAPRLSPSSRASPGGRAPWARTCSAWPSGALQLSGGMGATWRREPEAQWAPQGWRAGGRGDSAGPASARPIVWRGPGAECGGGGLAQTRLAPGAC